MRKRIGEFLVEKGVITQAQVTDILKYSEETGLRFGEAGLEMGLITRERMIEVFGPSFAVDFFHMDARYFPKLTQNLLPIEMIVRLGALPLGFKTERKLFRSKKVLNLGLLDPAAMDEVTPEILRVAAARLGKGSIDDVKVYLLLADQFLEVMRSVYSLDDEGLRKAAPDGMDDTLLMFLDGGI